MASTDPIELEPADANVGAIAADPLWRSAPHDDARRVRLYSRLAAALTSLAVMLLALAGAWLLGLLLDSSWPAGGTRATLAIATLIAAGNLALAELRSRRYDVSLTADAVTFEYGRTRSCVPHRHVQHIDVEWPILARIFGLRRCALQTAGGTVVVSPVTTSVAAALERLIHERPGATPVDQPQVDPEAFASAALPLSRRRRLHPMALFLPFGSYTGPERPGRRFTVPNQARAAIVLGVLVIIDRMTDSVTRTGDGGILVERTRVTWVDALVLTVAIAVGAALVARWWTFRWWVADDAIWTSGGIVKRWRRRVPFDRIVTVDRSTSPLQRLLGVSRIAMEMPTVDRATPDVLLGCVSNRDAARLDDLLISKLILDDDLGRTSRFDPMPIDHLSWWELVISGAMTLQVIRAGVVLYATIQALERFADISLIDQADRLTQRYFGHFGPVVEPLCLIVVLWLASTLHFIMSFSRFRLGRQEGWLVVETGVFRPMRRLIRTAAIQGLEVSRSPLQRRFRKKRAMLRMRLPAYGSPSRYAMVLHPAITDAALPALTSQLVGMDLATSEALCGQRIHGFSAGSRRAYTLHWPIRIAACCVAVLVMLLIVASHQWWWALTPLALAPPLAVAGQRSWQSAGWHADDGDWLVIQRGAFGLTSTAARVDRIQYVTWSQPLMSRRSSIVSMSIAVATSGGAGIVSHILAILRRPINPSIIRLQYLDAAAARSIAMASGYERSLPPELAVE